MQSDDVIWQIISKKHCTFRVKWFNKSPDPGLLQKRVQSNGPLQQDVLSAGQLPICHGSGGKGPAFPIYENSRENIHPREALGEGQAEQQLRRGPDHNWAEAGVPQPFPTAQV